MERSRIGQTDVEVTKISFGGASIGNLFEKVADADVEQVLAAAWDAGIRYFDTAPHYGRGRSEVRLGAFLSTRPRADYVISTKVGRVLTPGQPMDEADAFIDPLPNDVHYDYSGDGIEAALEGSLERLGTTRADIVFVHDIGTFTHGEGNAAHMADFFGSGYARLRRLKETGRIGAIGLGVNENEVCIDIMRDCPLDVILLAGRLTLLDRSAEDHLTDLCRTAGTSLVLGGVLNSGILATGATPDATYNYAPAPPDILAHVEALEAKAETLGLSLLTAAFLFARHYKLAASVLIGTADTSMLNANLAALQAPLPPGFFDSFA